MNDENGTLTNVILRTVFAGTCPVMIHSIHVKYSQCPVTIPEQRVYIYDTTKASLE